DSGGSRRQSRMYMEARHKRAEDEPSLTAGRRSRRTGQWVSQPCREPLQHILCWCYRVKHAVAFATAAEGHRLSFLGTGETLARRQSIEGTPSRAFLLHGRGSLTRAFAVSGAAKTLPTSVGPAPFFDNGFWHK